MQEITDRFLREAAGLLEGKPCRDWPSALCWTRNAAGRDVARRHRALADSRFAPRQQEVVEGLGAADIRALPHGDGNAEARLVEELDSALSRLPRLLVGLVVERDDDAARAEPTIASMWAEVRD